MSVIYGLLLQTKGEIKRIKLKDAKDLAPLTHDKLQDILKKKTPLKELGSYEHHGPSHRLTLFGYNTGKVGTENKHELPQPLNDETFYSDILLIASKTDTSWQTPITYTLDEYNKFYQYVMGGIDSDNESDEESDEESDDEKVEEVEEEIISKKKKVAEEDGVPEDEEDKEAEESDDADEGDEDEEGDDELVEDGEGGGGDDYEDEPVLKTRAISKKKATKHNLTVANNTGRAIQQNLVLRPGFDQITTVRPLLSVEKSSKEYIFRSRIYEKIQKIFATRLNQEQQIQLEQVILTSALTDADIKFVFKNFENKLFEFCYMNAVRRIIGNLNPDSYIQNQTLFTKIQNGDLQVGNLASMNVMDFQPAMYHEMRERQVLREQQQLEGNKAMATDMFMCPRCHKRETTFYELQTRSADEPMTKFINCLNCGLRWRK